MSYFNKHYFVDDSGKSLAHRAKYGTADSTSSEKGTDNKKNNTSQYNHDYYMKNKEKWTDNKESHDENSKDSETSEEQEKEFDVDAAARDVIRGKYGNGEDRKEALGEDYAMIQKRVNELMKQMKGTSGSSSEEKKEETKEESKDSSSLRSFEEAKKDYNEDKKKNKSMKHSDFGEYDSIGSIPVKYLL